MNDKTEMTLEEMIKAIEGFPYLRECFSDYLKWLCEECDENRRKYDAIYMKIATGTNTLKDFENLFKDFGNILSMNEIDFCKAFRFDVDRNKNEILKIGDLLAEAWAVIGLSNHGFNSIRKIPSGKSKMCDLTANYGSTKFAIEVKNLRSEEVENYYIWLTNTTYDKKDVFLSSYFGNSNRELHKSEEKSLQDRMMNLLNNDIKREKITEQLENAKKEYDCQATMLIGYLDLIVILGEFPEMIVNNLEKIRNQFPISDYLACCFNREFFCSPQLP